MNTVWATMPRFRGEGSRSRLSVPMLLIAVTAASSLGSLLIVLMGSS